MVLSEKTPTYSMMDVHHVPSAYSLLDGAEAAHGARAGKYGDFLWRTDPLADAAMQEFSSIPESEWRALQPARAALWVSHKGA